MKVKNLLVYASLGMLVVGFTSCLKSTPIEPPKPVSFISVVNGSYKAPAVELLNGSTVVTPPINPGAYFSRYSTIDPGAHALSFKKAGQDSLVAALSSSDYYDSSRFYTVLLFDNPSGPGAQATRIQDEFPQVDPTRAFVRFWQLSPDAANVDLYIESNKVFSSRTPADNVSNPSYNAFQSQTPGSFAVRARVAGTDSTIASTTFSDFAAGGIYTIFLKGVKNGVGTAAFSIDVLRAAN